MSWYPDCGFWRRPIERDPGALTVSVVRQAGTAKGSRLVIGTVTTGADVRARTVNWTKALASIGRAL